MPAIGRHSMRSATVIRRFQRLYRPCRAEGKAERDAAPPLPHGRSLFRHIIDGQLMMHGSTPAPRAPRPVYRRHADAARFPDMTVDFFMMADFRAESSHAHAAPVAIAADGIDWRSTMPMMQPRLPIRRRERAADAAPARARWRHAADE